MRRMKAQLMINFGEGGINNFRRHKIGEDLLSPNIVKPIHRNEIAKPHVCGFMCDHGRPRKNLILSGGCV